MVSEIVTEKMRGGKTTAAGAILHSSLELRGANR